MKRARHSKAIKSHRLQDTPAEADPTPSGRDDKSNQKLAEKNPNGNPPQTIKQYSPYVIQKKKTETKKKKKSKSILRDWNIRVNSLSHSLSWIKCTELDRVNRLATSPGREPSSWSGRLRNLRTLLHWRGPKYQ